MGDNGIIDVRRGDDLEYGPNIWLSVDGQNWWSIFKPVDMISFATLLRGRKPDKVIPMFHIKCEPEPKKSPGQAFNIALRVS